MTLFDVLRSLIAPTILASPIYYALRHQGRPEPRKIALIAAAWIFVPMFVLGLLNCWQIENGWIDPSIHDEGSDSGY